MAQVKSNVLPLETTRQWLKTPLSPYSQPSGPQVNEFGSSCVSVLPKPVTTTSRLISLPSFSFRNRRSGALSTHTPPWPTAMPVGIFRPSANMVTLSARPLPRVSSRILTRSRPGPASFRGYSRLSVTQMRPRSSNVMAIGFTRSGSAATSSTAKPSGTVIRWSASSGE